MKKLALVTLMLGMLHATYAQDVVSTAGGSIVGQGIQIDWTLGEVVTLTLEDESNAATQGFQQPVIVPDFSFSDPCACDDPENVLDRGFVIRYHDVITISSSSGDPVVNPFEIVEIIEGDVLTKDGATIIGSETAVSETSGQNQVINIWRVLGPRYSLIVEDTVTGERFEVAADTDCIPCPQIPSMGAWALFIFFLTLTNIALIKLREVQFA